MYMPLGKGRPRRLADIAAGAFLPFSQLTTCSDWKPLVSGSPPPARTTTLSSVRALSR
jgi:hypothetical protein